MALDDRDIIITPNKGSSSEPNILFRGADASSSATVYLRVYNSGSIGTISFEGSSGQLLSITDNMSGSIFSVNDISGIPSIEVFDTGEVRLAQYNGFVDILNTTPSTSTATGALQVVGGVGIGGNLYVGGTIYGNVSVSGSITTATNITGGTAGQVPYQTGPGATSFFGPGTAGNVLVSNGTSAPTYNNVLTLAGTTAATSTATGALQVRGGVGIGGSLYIGSDGNFAGITTVTNITNATSTATGALVVRGGLGVNRDTFIGGLLNIAGVTTVTNITAASSTATGALVVRGGVGIGGNLYAGGLASIAGSATVTGDLAVNGGDITSSAATFNLLNATVTTANVLGAGTNITIGAATGATTIRNNTTITSTTAASSTITGALQVRGGVGIGGNLHVGGTITGSISGSAGSLANAVTFNNGGSGDASGTTYNGSVARTISFNTIGAPQAGYISTTSARVVNGIISLDSRNFNNPPGDRASGLYVDFKANTTDGLSDGGTYHGVLTFRSYGTSNSDFTGGQAQQIAYTDSNNLWHRISTNSSTWGTWYKIIDTNNATSTNIQFQGLGVGTAASTGEIRASGEITAYYTSDARLKENVVLIADPIEKVMKIRGVNFNWTDEYIESRGGEDDYFVRKNDIGVIAQEVEEILPEAVATRENGYKAVKYEKIVPLLIEVVKEQQKQITQILQTLKDLASK